jgi:hypothetical protein
MSIKAMKQALEALENVRGYDVENLYGLDDEITALRQAIAEAEKQEPFAVAWVLDGELFWPSEYEVISQAGDKAIPLYTAPVHASDISAERVDETPKCKHEWVGLTDEDKHYLNEVLNLQGRFPIIDAIEAKLKEKNS